MRNHEILSIDLGSAYTKVAIRTGWGASSALLNDRHQPHGEIQFCIPTVVACLERNGAERWLAGVAAAAVQRGPEVLVMENWKAGLFGFPSSLSGDQCRLAAVKFFELLRESLDLSGYWEGVEGLPVRVCVPALGDRQSVQDTVAGVLSDSGWNAASGRLTVFEPESNTLGVLTRGINATVVPPSLDFQRPLGRTPYLQDMLEPGLRRAFERWEKGEPYGVLVADVGAFTTDFGYALFDTSLWDDSWKAPRIEQASFPTGVRDLDASIRKQLDTKARAAIDNVSSADWETRKAVLYSGQQVAFRDPRGGVVYVGTASERPLVNREIQNFAKSILELQREFRSSRGLNRINAAIMTGGGMMIDGVREAIANALGSEATVRLHDLMDPEEPLRSLSSGNRTPQPAEIEGRLHLNHQLVRGGSAIGGCSVFFE